MTEPSEWGLSRWGTTALTTVAVLYTGSLGASLAGFRPVSGLLLGIGTGILIITAVVAGIAHERR